MTTTTSLMTFSDESWQSITGWIGQTWTDLAPIFMPILGLLFGFLLINWILNTIFNSIGGQPDKPMNKFEFFEDEFKKLTGHSSGYLLGGKSSEEKGREEARDLVKRLKKDKDK